MNALITDAQRVLLLANGRESLQDADFDRKRPLTTALKCRRQHSSMRAHARQRTHPDLAR